MSSSITIKKGLGSQCRLWAKENKIMTILALIAGFFFLSTVITVSACMLSAQFGRSQGSEEYLSHEENVPVSASTILRSDPVINS